MHDLPTLRHGSTSDVATICFPSGRHAAERDLLAHVSLVIGLDYDLPSLKVHRSMRNLVRADARQLPFHDESFDPVTASMVVEHRDDPTS